MEIFMTLVPLKDPKGDQPQFRLFATVEENGVEVEHEAGFWPLAHGTNFTGTLKPKSARRDKAKPEVRA